MQDLKAEIARLKAILKQPSLYDGPSKLNSEPGCFANVRLKDKVDALKRLIQIRYEMEDLQNG
jgi:hypothetical protein